mmetsp:Transcript_18314/g.58341  ORF Transcript_18314/g.58341 Transcript_18314/m.58341 type:complete len:103 (-) Transcript_18314:949-1257(-)
MSMCWIVQGKLQRTSSSQSKVGVSAMKGEQANLSNFVEDSMARSGCETAAARDFELALHTPLCHPDARRAIACASKKSKCVLDARTPTTGQNKWAIRGVIED